MFRPWYLAGGWDCSCGPLSLLLQSSQKGSSIPEQPKALIRELSLAKVLCGCGEGYMPWCLGRGWAALVAMPRALEMSYGHVARLRSVSARGDRSAS